MKPHIRPTLAAWGLAILNVLVTTGQAQDYTYTTNGGTITITGGCPSSPGAVTIPATIIGLPVTSIGHRAFEGCASPTSMVILGQSKRAKYLYLFGSKVLVIETL